MKKQENLKSLKGLLAYFEGGGAPLTFKVNSHTKGEVKYEEGRIVWRVSTTLKENAAFRKGKPGAISNLEKGWELLQQRVFVPDEESDDYFWGDWSGESSIVLPIEEIKERELP